MRLRLTGNTDRQAAYISWNVMRNRQYIDLQPLGTPWKRRRSLDMKDILQIIALLLGFLACGSAVLSVHNHSWKVSTDDDSVIITSNIFENLWMSCAADSTGTFNCWNFQSMLALPGKTP